MDRLLSVVLFAAVICPKTAYALFYDVYRPDYIKGAFCSAIAGACASDIDPENSYFQNPASLGAGGSGLDFDGDFGASDNLEPGMKAANDVTETYYMAGISYAGRRWGWGLAGSGRRDVVKSKATLFDDQDRAQKLNVTTTSVTMFLNVPLSYRVTPHFTVGASLLGLYYHETLVVDSAPKSSTENLSKTPPVGISAGFIWSASSHLRVGSWIRSPISFYVHQSISTQAFANTINYDETIGMKFPYIWASGLSLMPWGDERTLFLDADIIGTTTDGFERTFDTFTSAVSETELRKKGRVSVVEPHIGWRAPVTSRSKLKYMLGAYYEKSRWDGLPSRAHGTAGLSFNAFGIVEILGGVDVARNYFQLLFTFR